MVAVQSKDGSMSLFFLYHPNSPPRHPHPAPLCLVWCIRNITTGSSRKPHKSSGGPYRTKGITWQRGTADAKGFNSGTTIRSLHPERRVVGSRLSAQVRSGDGSIINTVWVKPMTCFCCYPQLSDLSRKDGREDVGGKAKRCGWEGKETRGGVVLVVGALQGTRNASLTPFRAQYCSVSSY